MKLTPELISRSLSFINPLKDRELDLRGNKIPAIENLGVTKDQNDSIDFTDNDIRHLSNFPYLPRLRNLYLSNNRVTRIDLNLAQLLPNLQTLVLTNNAIQELGDLEPLSTCRKLQYLSLLDNPVSRKKYYRLYVIHKIPSVRVLDFKRIRDKERREADALFKLKDGTDTTLAKSISEAKSKTFEPGEGLPAAVGGAGVSLQPPRSNVPALGISAQEQAKIKEAIRKATSLEEITRLEKLLRSGQIPDQLGRSGGGVGGSGGDVEMEGI